MCTGKPLRAFPSLFFDTFRILSPQRSSSSFFSLTKPKFCSFSVELQGCAGVSLQQLKTDPCLGFECWVQWGSKFSVGLKWVFLSVIYNHRAITANTWLALCSCLVTNIFNFSWNRWHCFSFVNQFIAKGEGQRKGC